MNEMKRTEKIIFFFSLMLSFMFAVTPNVYGMHIMEGYLAPVFCVAWGVVSLPFLVLGCMKIKRILADNPKAITLFAMAGAYIFVLSALKIASVTGSCSHMTGTGLGAVLFGPCAVSILGFIVLLFQAILLAHGGLTTIGANTFSMAIAGPLMTFGIYTLCKKCKVNKRLSIFLATALGDLFTYCVTSMQLAIAYPSSEGGILTSMAEFLGIFAATQLPLAILEGVLSVMIIIALENYAVPELKAIGYNK